MGHRYSTQSYETQSETARTFSIGKEAIYIESGVRFRVEVFDNKLCNKVIERYSLRIKEVTTENLVLKRICLKPGEEFECQRLRTSGNRGIWALVEKA